MGNNSSSKGDQQPDSQPSQASQQKQKSQQASTPTSLNATLAQAIRADFLRNQHDGLIPLDAIQNILKVEHLRLVQLLAVFANTLFKSTNLNESQWLQLAEILIKAPDYPSALFPKHRPLDLFAIVMGYDSQQTISNQQCLAFLQALFSILGKVGAECAKYYMNRIYDDTLDENQRVGFVLNKLQQNLPVLADCLQLFWTQVFTQNPSLEILKQAKLLAPSLIITPEMLVLLSLNYNFQREMNLLYSNQSSGTSFNRLAWNILGYGGPTLIIIQLDKKQVITGAQYPIIFGAYNPQTWNDGLKFQSDQSCFLFSLSPSYRFFTTSGKEQYYAYLNTKSIERSKYKVGLGFGGNPDHTSFRLWIDDEIESNSKVASEDDTYQPGYIAGELEGRISIAFIEVWGLGGAVALEKQDQYRKERMEELERMRKVDKKQFFSGFDQAMFFEKTFAHKAQVREDAVDQ